MSNALQPIFDLFWDAGKTFFTWVFDGWIEPKKSLDDFFKAANIKNSLGEYPEVVIDNKTVFVVFVPAGLSVDDFLKHKDALELYLNNEVKMEASSGWVRIEMLKKLPKVIEYEIPKKTKELCIPFAVSGKGVEYINFKHEPHVLITGNTGSGKSITLRNIITSLISLYPDEVDLILIDFKIVELSLFKYLKQVEQYITDTEDAKEVLSDELETCKKRYALFEKIGVTNIYDYNKKVSKYKKLKYRFIVIEEFIMLAEDKKRIAMKELRKLSVISRSAGIFLIITGQRFDNTVIDLVMRSNIGNRLCHKMQDEANSKLIIDDAGAEKIKDKGRMIFKCNSEKIECQSYFIDEKTVKDIIKPYLEPKKEPKKDILSPNTNKGTLENDCIIKDKLQDKENKIPPVANKKADFEYDLSFLDKL